MTTTNTWRLVTRMPSGHIQIEPCPKGNPKGLVVQHRRRAGRGDFYQAWICAPDYVGKDALVFEARRRWAETYGLEAA